MRKFGALMRRRHVRALLNLSDEALDARERDGRLRVLRLRKGTRVGYRYYYTRQVAELARKPLIFDIAEPAGVFARRRQIRTWTGLSDEAIDLLEQSKRIRSIKLKPHGYRYYRTADFKRVLGLS